MSNTPIVGSGARAVTALRPVSKVVASYSIANKALGEVQARANKRIQMYLASDLTNDYNADALAHWRAELAGVRKLQSMALILQA